MDPSGGGCPRPGQEREAQGKVGGSRPPPAQPRGAPRAARVVLITPVRCYRGLTHPPRVAIGSVGLISRLAQAQPNPGRGRSCSPADRPAGGPHSAAPPGKPRRPRPLLAAALRRGAERSGAGRALPGRGGGRRRGAGRARPAVRRSGASGGPPGRRPGRGAGHSSGRRGAGRATQAQRGAPGPGPGPRLRQRR